MVATPIGWYENDNTLVVDTVGFNDKPWLDQMGHPQTDQLHLTERYKRVDATTLELDLTITIEGVHGALECAQKLHVIQDRLSAIPTDLLGA